MLKPQLINGEMKNKIKRLIVFCIVLYLSTAVFLYFFQSKLIYFPTSAVDHNYKTITVKNEDCLIDVIVLNSEKTTDKAIIYFGGNAETVVYNARDFQREFKDSVVYLMNYRSYGRSTGWPSEQANYSDALKLFDRVQKKYAKITVMGRSLGSGVASYVASQRDIFNLVLITPYDSIKHVAQSKFWMFPMSILLNQQYLSIDRVKDIEEKCLILIAEHDKIIPYENSKNMVDEFPDSQVEFFIIKNENHNTISHSEHYFDLINKFID